MRTLILDNTTKAERALVTDIKAVELYNKTALKCSKLITRAYSTSFSMGIHSLDSAYHDPIYAIYGFVRYADEIVDTFHNQDKKRLLNDFKNLTYTAIQEGFSTNPVLHSFQMIVNQIHIDHSHIDAFFHSMEMDLQPQYYDRNLYEQYIFGSAEVVGLMCLRVFCGSNQEQYDLLEGPAKRLGAAFQKVNFLRDLRSDFEEKKRSYFPDIDLEHFSDKDKILIETEIQADFDAAYIGVIGLPKGARLGVYLAYTYYKELLKKISQVSAGYLLKNRIRVRNRSKILLMLSSYFKHKMNWLVK